MKYAALVLALGVVVGATPVAWAQKAPATPDPLADLQKDFGDIVHANFEVPAPLAKAGEAPGSPTLAAGEALRTSMQVPGAIFAGVLQPFAEVDKTEAPAPAAAPKHRAHLKMRHHRVASQG